MSEITLRKVKHRAEAEFLKINGSQPWPLASCLIAIHCAVVQLYDAEAQINAALPLLPGAGPLGEVAVALNDAITMVVAHYTAEGAT